MAKEKSTDFSDWNGFQRILNFRGGKPFDFIDDDLDRAVYILHACANFSPRTIARIFGVTRYKVIEIIHHTRSVSTTYQSNNP